MKLQIAPNGMSFMLTASYLIWILRKMALHVECPYLVCVGKLFPFELFPAE